MLGNVFFFLLIYIICVSANTKNISPVTLSAPTGIEYLKLEIRVQPGYPLNLNTLPYSNYVIELVNGYSQITSTVTVNSLYFEVLHIIYKKKVYSVEAHPADTVKPFVLIHAGKTYDNIIEIMFPTTKKNN